ncbi:MAG: hypothetical protein HY738_00190 [Bacteroidia bacterium]|nr:hypothetical protein [Bacteroidia bacterium]
MFDYQLKSFLQDKSGNLWFGTSGGGVTVILSAGVSTSLNNPQSNRTLSGAEGFDGRPVITFTEKQGLSNNYVFGMLEDNSGNLWFGTRFGLSKLTNPQGYLTKNNSRCNGSDVEQGDLAGRSISEGSNSEYGDLAGRSKPLFKTYTYEDGFLGIGVNGGNNGKNVYEAGDGTIWIAANDRLMCTINKH